MSTGGVTVRAWLGRPGVLRAMVVSAVVLAALEITVIFLPALGVERDIAAGAIGVLLGIRAVAAMASRLLLGRLASAFGRRKLLVAGIALGAACLLVIPLPMPLWALGLLMTSLGLGLA